MLALIINVGANNICQVMMINFAQKIYWQCQVNMCKAAYDLSPSTGICMALCISLIHSIHKQIIYKNCLYAGNS